MHTVDLLASLNQPLPRYTSYPTAPQWGAMDSLSYRRTLESSVPDAPLSLYIHIPFCKTMCLFCGCSVILNRKEEPKEQYVQTLCQEIHTASQSLGRRHCLQLHFGGGTPTELSVSQFDTIMDTLRSSFTIDPGAEIAIEIDPRTIEDATKLAHLKHLGFNRVSFGVQDTNPKVQEAIRRRQSAACTEHAFSKARQLGFQAINIDLIYGLPYQTETTFAGTVDSILHLRPDRIALFSYAKVPWLKPHQKAIKDETLPTQEEKFRIYVMARTRFIEAGYQAIGMDHFALPDNELAKAYHAKTLHRNFQGYTVFQAEDLIGFGVTAIGTVQGNYFQNAKDIEKYSQAIQEGKLAVDRGLFVNSDDITRRFVINSIMCHFRVDKELFFARFHIPFDTYFQGELTRLTPFIEKGLCSNSGGSVLVTPMGELFVRNIASCFDFYFHQQKCEGRFSQSI